MYKKILTVLSLGLNFFPFLCWSCWPEQVVVAGYEDEQRGAGSSAGDNTQHESATVRHTAVDE